MASPRRRSPRPSKALNPDADGNCPDGYYHRDAKVIRSRRQGIGPDGRLTEISYTYTRKAGCVKRPASGGARLRSAWQDALAEVRAALPVSLSAPLVAQALKRSGWVGVEGDETNADTLAKNRGAIDRAVAFLTPAARQAGPKSARRSTRRRPAAAAAVAAPAAAEVFVVRTPSPVRARATSPAAIRRASAAALDDALAGLGPRASPRRYAY